MDPIHNTSNVVWVYWVDDGIDGKTTNWYPFENKASAQIEELYQSWKENPSLAERVVKSNTYSYLVNLNTMTQTNISHPNRTVRQLRRRLGNFPQDSSAPPLLTSSWRE